MATPRFNHKSRSTRRNHGDPVTAPHGNLREGYLYGLAAYGWWGLVPLYFKLILAVPPLEILAHRIVWSLVFLAGLLTLLGSWRRLARCFTARSIFLKLCASAALIAVNWFVYITSVASARVQQSSLGYFLTPLVSVVLGMVFFGERLRRLQALALLLAAAAVLYLTIAGDEFPWIALTLAVSFGLYGLVRKALPVDGLVGLSVETILLLPLAGGYLIGLCTQDALELRRHGLGFGIVVALSGVVTAIPLMCFAQAARRLPLSTLGFLQYLSPSLQFVAAVLVFHEPFDVHKGVSFVCIWTALAFFTWDAIVAYRRQPYRAEANPVPRGDNSLDLPPRQGQPESCKP